MSCYKLAFNTNDKPYQPFNTKLRTYKKTMTKKNSFAIKHLQSDFEPDVEPDDQPGVQTIVDPDVQPGEELVVPDEEPIVQAQEEVVREAEEEHVVAAEVGVRTRKQSERIVKLKLAKKWGGEGSNAEKPLDI